MGSWMQLCMVLSLLGIELDIFAINGYPWLGKNGAIEAMEICGFISYLIAVLIVLLIHFGELSNNRGAIVAFIIFVMMAGAFMIIGLGIYGANNSNVPVYPTTLLVTGAFLAVLASIFGIVSICRC